MAKEKDKARAAELRKRAEKMLAEGPQAILTMVPADIQKLVQELNVYQIELELQNEELRRTQLELQEARDRYLNLYDFAPTGYFTLDHNSLIVDVNLAGSELLGSEKHRLIGTQFTSSISPDSQDAFYFHWREVLKTGIKGNCELKMLKADGTLFPAQLISMGMPEKDGNINQFRTAVIDITERRKAEETLRQSEEKYRTLFETMAQGVVYQSADGKIFSANPAAERILGLTLDQMLGRTSTDPRGKAIHEDGSDFPGETHPSIIALKTGNEVKDVVMGVFNPGDEQYHWINIYATPQFRPGKSKPYQGYTTFADITEHKQADEALREAKEFSESLITSARDGISVLDNHGVHIDVNPALCEMTGFLREELIGVGPPHPYWPPEQYEEIDRAFQKTMAGDFADLDLTFMRKNGERFPVIVSPAWIKDRQGNVISYFATVKDITERKQMEEALKESEEKYHYLAENASDIIGIVDTNLRCTYMSPSVTKVRGYTVEEAMAQSLEELFTPSSAETAVKAFTEELAIESLESKDLSRVQTLELEFTCKNGSTVWCEVKASLIRDADGQPVGILAAARETTERRKSEEALRRSEERYRGILEDMEESYYETDLAGNFTVFNDALCRHLGYSREEMMGMNYLVFTPPEDVKRVSQASNQVYRTGEPVELFPREMIRKDGSRTFTETSIFPLRNEGGEIIGWRGVGRDVTERKWAEEALRQSEERYRTILEEIEDSYFEVDLAGNLTFINDAVCHHLGYPREELLGMNYRGFTAEENIEHVYQAFNEVYRTGEPNKGFLWGLIRKDGSIGFADASVSLLRSQGGEIIGFRGVGRDITERKMAEEKRMQLELKAQISSRLASVGEMAAGVAHEINNPLTAVTGYAQLLVGREDIPSDIRSDLEAINDGARRVAGIVRTLLAFSRQTKPQRKLADINELIESTLVLRAYHLRVNNIEVVTRLAPDVLETVVDPGQIQQVLLNLIVNAEMEMKLAHGKGRLTITTEKSDNTIKICVKDNGPGIMPEVMDKIFDPFFTTREVGQGTGLGLSLCYGIITEHKGKIYAESKPGKGATFIVELPVATEAKPPKPAEPIVKKPKKAVKARILVVDDEQVVRDVVNRVLTGEGHKVDTVDNAVDALKKIESKRYKLILVDIKMPGINGVTLYKRIQKIDKSLARRVVFITGDVMGADTEKFLSETKVAHIDKPFDAEQLSREVQRTLTAGR
ncbi:MAG: PAS domain S-box protein [Dehalococcoidia bacterium]